MRRVIECIIERKISRRGRKIVLHCGNRLRDDFGVISKPMHPIYVRLASKPGHLPLGVIAVGLLDSVDGGFGFDRIFGGPDNDTIVAGDGGSIVWGGAGNDTITGGTGRNWLHGGLGDDTVTGGPLRDRLWVGAGVDTENGGDGNDVLHALFPDGQVDTLDCGPGDHDVAWIRQGEPDVVVNCEVVKTLPPTTH